MDFLGNRPGNPPAFGEGSVVTSPTMRVRHAMVKLQTPVVDVLAGQYWQLFGWQSGFHPNTVEIQGVPGQVYSRAPQLRLLRFLSRIQEVNREQVPVAVGRPPVGVDASLRQKVERGRRTERRRRHLSVPALLEVDDRVPPASTHVRINYQSMGSGAGIRQITERTVDFGASDAPMTDEQLGKATGKLIHVPTTLGAVVVTYNLPGNTPELKMSPEILAGIFLGQIGTWNEPPIAALNAGVTLPAKAITVAHRIGRQRYDRRLHRLPLEGEPRLEERVGTGTSVSWPVGLGAQGKRGGDRAGEDDSRCDRLRGAGLRQAEQASHRADQEQGRKVRHALDRQHHRRCRERRDQHARRPADVDRRPAGRRAPIRSRRSPTSWSTRTRPTR